MDDNFHSLHKGVFVVPFKPNPVAGPSTTVPPLDKTYTEANSRYAEAYWDHEEDRTAEQLDEITMWLEECDAFPVFSTAFPIHRLPVALVQNLSPSIVPHFSSLDARHITLNGRDMSDLAAATRAVAVGFLGEAALVAKKAGRTPIDEVHRWWDRLREQSSLLVHIENAQLIPSTVLSELIYILNLHHQVLFRLLISVPSIAVFTSNWSLLEPGDVSLSILSAGRSRRRGAGVNAILKAASDSKATPISITDSLKEELQRQDDMFGGGAKETLKSLKWLLLHHSHNSPLAALAGDGSASLERGHQLQNVVQGIKDGRSVPGPELFTMDCVPDMISTQNPATRLSVLQALSKPATFLSPVGQEGEEDVDHDDDATPRRTQTNNATLSGQGRKRKAPDSPSSVPNSHTSTHPDNAALLGQRFQEIEALHALWRSAGKSVNLWDWLEGFRGALSKDNDDETTGEQANGVPFGRTSSGEDKDMEEQAQHATFIRFIEESRMLGLVRARGSRTSRRADEVVKGVLMI